MNTIIERITEAIKDILIGLIKSSLDNMFTSVNEQVGTIAGQVGQTPQGWNAGIFNLIQNLSQTTAAPKFQVRRVQIRLKSSVYYNIHIIQYRF